MDVIAETTSGAVAGVMAGGVAVFRAVPYAAPPVGRWRFAAPAPPRPWAGRRATVADGPIAPQNPSRLAAAMGDFRRPMAEDCLTLTIWTPAADAGRRPVLVWLHGGAWISGAGSLAWYDGGVLAREAGIVVVAVNYRLGALGYLHHPGLTPAEGDPGTLDQAAALAWVQQNVAAFGGDPARVTLAGQSAGAASIGRLLLHPVARTQFRAAILQSGSFGRPSPTHAEAAETARQFAEACGFGAAGITESLRAAPVAALLAGQTALARARARFADTNPPFMPTVPAPLPEAERLAAIAAAAAADGKPLLIGTTRDEAHAFFATSPALANPAPEAVRARFAAFGANPARYRARRPGGSPMALIADVTGDHIYRWPAMRLAAAARGPVFAWQFDWSPPGSRFGACHCIELPFVFGNFADWPGAGMLAGGDAAEMAALSARVRAFWAAFIHHGDPSLPDLPWPRYDTALRQTMLLDRAIRVVGDAAGIESG